VLEQWQQCIEQLEREISPQLFRTWIRPLVFLGCEAASGTVRIGCPNAFKLNWVRQQWGQRLESMLRNDSSGTASLKLQFEVCSQATASAAQASNSDETEEPRLDPPCPHDPGDPGDTAPSSRDDAGSSPASATPSPQEGIQDNRFVVVENNKASPSAARQPRSASQHPEIGRSGETRPAIHTHLPDEWAHSTKLNRELSFENFVTGKSNQMARAAALQVSQRPGLEYNPLFIYGGVGLGKTHLMHAVGNALRENTGDRAAHRAKVRVRYIHAQEFFDEMVRSIQRKNSEEMRAQYQKLDLFLIDDIQFLSNKPRTQEEFFYLFEALFAARKQIILTCDTYPKEMSGVEERLVSRFDSGLIVAIEPPDLETRTAILHRKAELRKVHLPDDVAFFVAKNLRSNVRELEGALNRLVAASSFRCVPICLELAKEALQDLLDLNRPAISVETIQKTVADYYKLKIADMYSKRRPAHIALARQVAMYMAKELTQKSLPEIGELFGGRDHTTVLHAVRRISARRMHETELNHALKVLEQTLRS